MKKKSSMKSEAEHAALKLKKILVAPVTIALATIRQMKLLILWPKLAPCQKSNLRKYLNFPMAKSEKELAWEPSLPKIPMPTCAVYIMLTSLAPSPIARVVLSLQCFLIKLTIVAFCFGEDLYITKPLAYKKASISYWRRSLLVSASIA